MAVPKFTASFVYTINQNSYRFTNLANPFNSRYYKRAIVSTSPCVNGSKTAPSGIIKADGSFMYPVTETETQIWEPGNREGQTVHGSLETANGTYINVGSAVVTR